MKVILTGVLAVLGAVAVVSAFGCGEWVCREISDFLEQY